jgi:hypothetical protein
MADPDWLQGETSRALVDEAVARILKQYRIDDTAARELVEESFARDSKLRALVEDGKLAGEIQRTRVFDDALVAAKRTAYQELRRYSADQEKQAALIQELEAAKDEGTVQRVVGELVRSHASTRERLAAREAFYAKLREIVGSPRTILDVGCGMHPLMHPLRVEAPEIYVGVDKDAASISAVKAYGRTVKGCRMLGIRWDIREGWAPILAEAGVREFDVAYLFKVVPVVQRQEADLIEVLARTPAKRWVITGSAVALAKKQDIARRERGALLRFCKEAGLEVKEEFTVGEEIGAVVEKGVNPSSQAADPN